MKYSKGCWERGRGWLPRRGDTTLGFQPKVCGWMECICCNIFTFLTQPQRKKSAIK